MQIPDEWLIRDVRREDSITLRIYQRGIECAKPSDSTPPRNRDLYSGRVSERGEERRGERDSFAGARRIAIEYISSGLSVASLFPFHRGKIKSYTRGEGGQQLALIYRRKRDFFLFSCFKIMRGSLRGRDDEIVIERKRMRGFITNSFE